MSDIGSTSGHLGPSQVFKDNGLDPQKDIEIIHTSKEIAWESLKKGDVSAWVYNATSVGFIFQRHNLVPKTPISTVLVLKKGIPTFTVMQPI